MTSSSTLQSPEWKGLERKPLVGRLSHAFRLIVMEAITLRSLGSGGISKHHARTKLFLTENLYSKCNKTDTLAKSTQPLSCLKYHCILLKIYMGIDEIHRSHYPPYFHTIYNKGYFWDTFQ